jgi:lipoprotein Spr
LRNVETRVRAPLTIATLLLATLTAMPGQAQPPAKPAPARDSSLLSGLGRTLDAVAESAGNTIEWLNPLAFKYALKLDLPVEDLGDDRLLRFFEEWIGVKYRLGGDSKAGIDCSALTRRLLKDVYSLTVGRVIPDQFQAGIQVAKSDLAMGDLIFFKISNRRPGPTHVGIYLGNNRFIHASIKKGVTIENLEKPYYQTYYRSAVRLPK